MAKSGNRLKRVQRWAADSDLDAATFEPLSTHDYELILNHTTDRCGRR